MTVIAWGDEVTTPMFERWAVSRMPHMDLNIGVGPCKTAAVCTGYDASDTLLAVILYHAFDPLSRTVQISISAASPRWISKGTVRTLLAVPFDQWACRKVWSVVASDNLPAQKLCGGLGFKLEARMRHQMAHKVHAFVYGMMESEFRSIWTAPRLKRENHGWVIGANHGQEIRAIAA